MKHAFVIILIIMSYLLSTDIYTPSMPEIARYFEASSDEVQKTMSYFLLGSVLACFFAGLLADKYGKKNFLLAGMTLAVFASIFTLICPNVECLILGRFLQGLGSGVAPVIGYAAIQDLYDDEKQTKIFGIVGISISTIPAVAPFMGGLISTAFHWKYNFLVLMLLFITCLVCVYRILPESLNNRYNEEQSKDAINMDSGFLAWRSYREILTSRAFLTLALLSPLYNAVEWFYLSFLPFYVQDVIGLSARLYGLIVGILIVWFAVGSSIGTRLVNIYGTHKTIVIALATGICASILLWITAIFFPLSIYGICIPLSIFITAFGILFPSSVKASLNILKKSKTRVSSLRSLFITGFAYFGSLSAEWIGEKELSSLAFFISLCSLLAVLIYLARVKNQTH